MSEKMNVGGICTRLVVVANEDMCLKDAAALMRSEHVGSLVVVRDMSIGKVAVGILTDRDIAVIAMAREFDPQSLRVADLMSAELITARPDDSFSDALAIMRSRGVRRLPVTDDKGVLIGIVTLDDLLEVVAEEMRGFVQAIESAQKQERRVRV